MFLDSDVLALKLLLFFSVVTSHVRWQLLRHDVEQLRVAEGVFAVGELSKRVFETQGEGPFDAVGRCLDFHHARF